MFFKIDVLKNFAIFAENHLCWSLFFNKVKGLKLQHKSLPVNIANFLRIDFFNKTPPVAASNSKVLTQQTFQRRFNLVFRLIRRCDVAQRQTNVETTLCTSTFKFTTLNNVESTLSISTLI